MSGESGVSKEELAAREGASLAFPGSALLEESGHDEGEGWGFDNMALTAMLTGGMPQTPSRALSSTGSTLNSLLADGDPP
jgi:hypothetical protein